MHDFACAKRGCLLRLSRMTTEPTNESLSPARAVAQRLALELSGYNEVAGQPYPLSPHLTQVQRALVADVYGLLNGMGHGMITTGVSRVQQSLVLLISELADAPHSAESTQIIKVFTSLLAQASTAGLTTDNQPLTSRLTQRAP